jgi:hypothetical protein
MSRKLFLKSTLKTGDLVVCNRSFWGGMFSTPPLGWANKYTLGYLGRFTFGLYLSLTVAPKAGSNEQRAWAFVFDSQSMNYGWVMRRDIERVQ